eukprot:TRINITY_DN5972_c0_g1_i1.p1 TRINITY_DN5972_c0_g1~~TRINITY_DN5972_c0_g1_i1.p1  ORF type:complete len:1139 (-),score=133.61 TRINITY_DN5972_c0_g1_i1:60-3410(-)
METPADLPSDVWRLILRRLELKNLGIVSTSCAFFQDLAWRVNDNIFTGVSQFSSCVILAPENLENPLTVDCLRDRSIQTLLNRFKNVTSIVGEGHTNTTCNVSEIRQFQLPRVSFDYQQDWWSEKVKEFTTLQVLSTPILGHGLSIPENVASSLRVLELTDGATWARSPRNSDQISLEHRKALVFAVNSSPHLETLILPAAEYGSGYLKDLASHPSIRNFSAYFHVNNTMDSLDKLHVLGAAHIRLFSNRQTFFQVHIIKDKEPVSALTKFHKLFLEKNHASLDPTLPHLFPAADNLNTALETAIAHERLDAIDFLLKTCKVSIVDSRPVRQPVRGLKGRKMPSGAEIDWGVLELAVCEMSPEALAEFLMLLPPNVLVTSSTLTAVMLVDPKDRQQKLDALLQFAASRGVAGFDFTHLIKVEYPKTFAMHPIHYALSLWLRTTPRERESPSEYSNYSTLLDFLQKHASDTLLSALDDGVFVNRATALHCLCESNHTAAAGEIERLVQVGCNTLARDKIGQIPLDVYLRSPAAPWLPCISPPLADLREFIPQSGDFKHQIFRFPRPGLEPLLRQIVPADKEPRRIFWRNLFRSQTSHPDVVKYLLLEKWDLPLSEIISQPSLTSLASVTIPRDEFSLAAESFIDERDEAQFIRPRPNDPLLAILFRLNVPVMKTEAYGRRLLRCLNLMGASGILLSLLEGHGLMLPTSEDEVVEIIDEYKGELCVVEFLVNRVSIERRMSMIARIIPSLDSKASIQHIVKVTHDLIVGGWHTRNDADCVPRLLQALLRKLSMWTTADSKSPDPDFWSSLRASRLGHMLDLLIAHVAPPNMESHSLVVALSAGCAMASMSIILDSLTPSSASLDALFSEMLVGHSSDPFSEIACKELISQAIKRGHKISVVFPATPICVRHRVLTQMSDILRNQILTGFPCEESAKSFARSIVRWWHLTANTPRVWNLDLWKSICQLPDPADPTKLLFKNSAFLESLVASLNSDTSCSRTMSRMIECQFFHSDMLKSVFRSTAIESDDLCIFPLEGQAPAPSNSQESPVSAFAAPSTAVPNAFSFSNALPAFSSASTFAPAAVSGFGSAGFGSGSGSGMFKPSAFGSKFGNTSSSSNQ